MNETLVQRRIGNTDPVTGGGRPQINMVILAPPGCDSKAAAHSLEPAHIQGSAGSDGGSPSIVVGSIEILPRARALLLNGVETYLGGRAFDVLMVLAKACGKLVSKDMIISQVWPTTTVVETNLKVQLSLLRRAFGAEGWRIKTVHGRGYMLVLGDAQPSPPTEPEVEEQRLMIVLSGDSDTRMQLLRTVAEVVQRFGAAASLQIA